jgi:hypothetical protein
MGRGRTAAVRHSGLTTPPYTLKRTCNGLGRRQRPNGGANVRCLKNRTRGIDPLLPLSLRDSPAEVQRTRDIEVWPISGKVHSATDRVNIVQLHVKILPFCIS